MKKLKQIIATYVGRLQNSICIETGQEYPPENFREFKYKGLQGLILLVHDKNTIVQWHPFEIEKSQNLLLLKGIVTTPANINISEDGKCLLATTENTVYTFVLDPNKNAKTILKTHPIIRLY